MIAVLYFFLILGSSGALCRSRGQWNNGASGAGLQGTGGGGGAVVKKISPHK